MKQNEFPKLSNDLSKLNAFYVQLVHDGRIDQAGTLQKSIDAANKRWNSLEQAAVAALQDLEQTIEMKKEFDANLQSVKSWLSALDQRLTAAENFSDVSRLKSTLMVSSFVFSVFSSPVPSTL
jgi:uncharacterized protein YPO0396